MTRNVVVVGATSAIAQAFGRRYAYEGVHLYLVARNHERLEEVSDDLRARGAGRVTSLAKDPADPTTHAVLLESMRSTLGTIDVALLAWGNLPDPTECERSADAVLDQLRVNATSPIALLTRLAPIMAEQDQPSSLAVLSSVAGDRGRRSNYAYGAAKAALSTFTEGLDARYRGDGVSITLIKPGFVDTPMTAGITLPGLLVSSADRVAACIDRGIQRRRTIVYAPWVWWGIMFVIRHLPSPILRRLNL